MLCVSAAADQLTPSGSAPAPSAVAPQQAPLSMSFEDAKAQISAVLLITLDRFDQVIKNSFNWKGPADASLKMEIGLAPQALVISGELFDDYPLVQTRTRPLMEDWWEITYGADGVELELDDPTSSSRKLKFLFNFSSAGTNPQMELLQSPSGLQGSTSPGSQLRLQELPAPDRAKGMSGIRLEAVIPTQKLAEPGFFTQPLRIVTRLHDVDGDFSTYLMMQDVLEKP